ncbi:MAG: VIT and VWA domain-containing protein [Clostridium sp.]|jgi:Ca-activated chloride channel family protein|uniref:VIT and vWA domain-containing protein n=1 Tax=Clostridium sp. TaxID=1506 RepID=UPI0025BA0C2B|nr:VIT and VWA domain-containing protein [Clostridium sp.]MCH3963800.1 VIT and VWA domain-containing protein [Clostridium sp.]MCI1714941.1 VIT and VWA domain-containing protein [Clostridium sp.]MCI1798870.1 VIT and VWA domain-containing protein [Clostridium sp.]MCI1813124.1 VIT and VWA domain-containing protein [Clostridium sp.]MCI1870014.1 VIT and VWA domain-containing protein [Clostridium sp.]
MQMPYRCDHEEMQLKEVSINGNLCAGYGEIFINQTYQNTSKENIEGIYVFPMPDTAVISGFEAEIGGRILKALVEDKNKVNKIYENSGNLEQSHFSLEEFNPHFFKISLGKIIPGETVKIKFSYIDELEYSSNIFRLTIPGISRPGILKNESGPALIKNRILRRIKKNTHENEKLEFKSNIIVESMSRLNFKSLYHNVKIEREGYTTARISFNERPELTARDFVLLMKEENTQEADGMIYEYKNEDHKNGIVYMRIIPKLDKFEFDRGKRYIFLMDISYTMYGEKLKHEKDALQLCLRNMLPDDEFNIIAMGDRLEKFSQDMLDFNQDSLDRASKWIDELNIESDANIFEAIKYSIEEITEPATILMFTDDEIGEEENILSYVRKNIGQNTIFTFGVGDFANNYFLSRLAHESMGKAEFIDDSEKIEDVVLRQFNRIQNPQIENIKIDWGKLQVKATYPRTIEYIYDREPFSIFARVVGDVGGQVVLSGNVNGEEYLREIDIDSFNTEENANLLKKVWGRKRIESIKTSMKTERGDTRESMRKKIVEISKENGIISSETKFILMELREEPVLGIQLRNVIPVKVSEMTERNLKSTVAENRSIRTGFLYKNSNTDDNLYLNKKYPREKLIKIIAKNQFADGSFADYENCSKRDKIKTTSMAVLSFAMGKGNIDIYSNQINKAANFICENYKNIDFHKEIDITRLIILSLTILNKKNFLKDKYKGKVEKTISDICDILYSCKNTRDILVSLMNNSLGKNAGLLFRTSEDGKFIDEEIILKDEKNSIFNMSKLAVLMSLAR